jgi:PhnB protein
VRISPHLCFDGQCREAMQMYQSIFGGTLQTILTYGESPMASSLESRWHDRILHATLVLNEVELTGVDMIPGLYERPQGFFRNAHRDRVSQRPGDIQGARPSRHDQNAV